MKYLIKIATVISVMFLFFGCQTSTSPDKWVSGVSGGKFSEIPASPNAVSSQTEQAGKYVEALAYRGTRQESMDRMLGAFEDYGTHELVTMDDNYIHAVFITGFSRFRDDLELYFDDASELIHYRSASRVGYSDMGLNRKRYNELRMLYMNE